MNRLIFPLIGLLFLMVSSNAQTIPSKNFYSKDFNWEITIPEDFEAISDEELEQMQSKGLSLFQQLNGREFKKATIIFVFKSDKFNCFEANYLQLDSVNNENYLQTWKNTNDVMYKTFETKMPDVKIDTTRTVAIIDNLEFQVFKIAIEYPNKLVANMIMYNRLFDKKLFTVNIIYVDKLQGEQMLKAWVNSKFKK